MMTHSRLESFIVLIWCILFFASPCSSQLTDYGPPCTLNTTAQGEALVSLYHATNGPSWLLHDDWLNMNITCFEPFGPLQSNSTTSWPPWCCWYGVECCVLHLRPDEIMDFESRLCSLDKVGGVFGLYMNYNNLTGPFPNDQLGALACSLSELFMSNNNLSGTISPDLGPLPRLTSLSLGSNNLSGMFPAVFGDSPVLTALALDNNAFIGELPKEVCGHERNSTMKDISLSNNQFTYLRLGNCTNLITLVADNNNLGASSDAQVAELAMRLPNLHIIRITDSQLKFNLSGNIFVSSPALSVAVFSRNRVRGTIPGDMAELHYLLILAFNSNPWIHGTLPAQFSQLVSLVSLDLSGTSVSGTIPDNWGTFATTGNTLVLLKWTFLGCCFDVTFLDDDENMTLPAKAGRADVFVPRRFVLSDFNLSAKLLPDFLYFVDAMTPYTNPYGFEDRHMRCPMVRPKGNGPKETDSQFFQLDPLYYMFKGCECNMGYIGKYIPEDPTGTFLTCTEADPPSSSRNDYVWIVAFSVPVSVFLLAVAVVGFIMWRRVARGRHLTTFGGKVKAPTARPETTLLVTDIEDSTVLWEKAPLVMDAAVRMHHDIIRRCVLQHAGYESATEGDSFILAFHDASSAAQCASSAQRELLHCRWPAELYDVLPACQRVYVTAPMEAMARAGSSTGVLPLNVTPAWRLRAIARETVATFRHWCHFESQPERLASPAEAPSAAHPATREASSLKPNVTSMDESSHRTAVNSRSNSGSVRRPARSPGNRPLHWLAGVKASFISNDRTGSASSPASLRALPAGRDAATVTLISSPSTKHAHTVLDYLLRVAPKQSEAAPGNVLLFAGLRVRMGMNTGVNDAGDVFHDRASGRMTYRGAFMAAAKVVQDAAQGAMVLLSEKTFEQLPAEELLACHVLVAHMGEHRLKGLDKPTHLYAVVSHTLLPRLALLAPVRSVEQLSSSFLSAPFRRAAIAFMTAAGKDALMAWNKEVAHQALDIYQELVQAELCRCGGYLVEAPDGLCLAAFGIANTDAAIRWAVRSIALCLQAPWPTELMTHELGEVVAVNNHRELAGRSAHDTSFDDQHPTSVEGFARRSVDHAPQVLFRGLRVKCGIDVGEVVADVHAVQGRMTYRGRVMNRAARIGAVAKSGQVWCSKSAWEKAAFSDAFSTAAARRNSNLTPSGAHALTTLGGAGGGPQTTNGAIAMSGSHAQLTTGHHSPSRHPSSSHHTHLAPMSGHHLSHAVPHLHRMVQVSGSNNAEAAGLSSSAVGVPGSHAHGHHTPPSQLSGPNAFGYQRPVAAVAAGVLTRRIESSTGHSFGSVPPSPTGGGPHARHIHGVPLGPYRLKGVGDMQLYHCVPQGDVLVGAPSGELCTMTEIINPSFTIRKDGMLVMSRSRASRPSRVELGLDNALPGAGTAGDVMPTGGVVGLVKQPGLLEGPVEENEVKFAPEVSEDDDEEESFEGSLS